MTIKNKINVGIAIAGVILIASIAVLRNEQNQLPGTDVAETPVFEDVGTATTDVTEVGSDTSEGTSTPQGNKKPAQPKTPSKPAVVYGKGYDATLNSYRSSGYIFQFSDCKIAPRVGSLIIKQGAKFAVQNISPVAHNFKLGSFSYSIPASGYIIYTAQSIGAMSVTCESGGAKVTVTVQK